MREDGEHSQKPLIQQLRAGSSLASWLKRPQRIPKAICDLMIASLENDEAKDQPETNLYEAAKNRFNRLRAGISNDNNKSQTIGEQFGTVRRALTAYWMEKKWEAGSKTASILGLTTLASANMVWLASASGKLTDSFVDYINNAADPALLAPVAEHGALVGGLTLLLGTSHAISSHLETLLKRDMGSWIVNKFSDAALKDHDTIYRLSHNNDQESEAPDVAPDAPLYRIMDAARDMPDEILNISKGTWSAISSSTFVALALYHDAVPVDALDELANVINDYLPNGFIDLAPEEKGTFVAALVALAAFSTVNMPFLRNFSKKLQAASEKFMQTTHKFYETLGHTFHNGASIAAAKTHNTRRASLHAAWANRLDAHQRIDDHRWRFRQFIGLQSAMATGAAATPGLAGVFSGNLSFGGFTQQTVLLGTLMHNLRYLLNIVPETANLKITAKRLSDLALMIDKATDRQSFYRLSGFHEFEYHETDQALAPALEVEGLRLLHRGQTQDEKAFVTIPYLRIEQGDRLYVKGASGCGKTSTLKAICGLWGYGEGVVAFPKGQQRVYAEQFVDVPYHMSLADLVRYGSSFEAFKSHELDDEDEILEALQQCGLLAQLGLENKTSVELQKVLESATNKGQQWANTLSGGQKQRLMLARLIYQQPDLILLDEPTSALDKDEGQLAYFKTLAKCCPDATILVIMHDDAVINPNFGFFNKMLEFDSRKWHNPRMIGLQEVEAQSARAEAHI